MNVDVHEFLIDKNGELTRYGEVVPTIREYIANRPKTCAMFELNYIDDLDNTTIPTEALELAGSWLVPDTLIQGGTNTRRKFANPNYEHAHRLTDIVVRCDCGALISQCYDDARFTNLDVEHDHDGCKKYHRLEARAKLLRRRESVARRVTSRFGWTTRETAARLGMEYHTLTTNLGVEIGELRKEFLRTSGNTYALLTQNDDVSAGDVAEIYGVSSKAMRKRAREHTDFEFNQSTQQWELPVERQTASERYEFIT